METKSHTIKSIGGTNRRIVIEHANRKNRLAIGFYEDKNDSGKWFHCTKARFRKVALAITA